MEKQSAIEEITNVSIEQCSKILGVTERKVRKMINERELAHVRIGRRVLVPTQVIRTFIEKNTIPALDREALKSEFRGKL
ncbi:helix-turn-helix domain-containing protein [bacterium]|nr:helix-turn-helix domain-containing protein [bacterium]